MDSFFIFGAEYLYLLSAIIAFVFFLRLPKDLKKRVAICATIALPLTYLVALLAGSLYYNPQPFVVGNFQPLIPHDIDNGFPSHHTLLTAAIAAVVWFYNKKIGNILWIIAFLVGVSRMYVGVHYPVDVLASLVIAFVVTRVVVGYLNKRKTEPVSIEASQG